MCKTLSSLQMLHMSSSVPGDSHIPRETSIAKMAYCWIIYQHTWLENHDHLLKKSLVKTEHLCYVTYSYPSNKETKQQLKTGVSEIRSEARGPGESHPVTQYMLTDPDMTISTSGPLSQALYLQGLLRAPGKPQGRTAGFLNEIWLLPPPPPYHQQTQWW